MKDHSLSVIRLDNKNPVPHQKKIFLLHVTLFYPLLFKAKKKKKRFLIYDRDMVLFVLFSPYFKNLFY